MRGDAVSLSDGFEVPIHRSLTQPIMFAGLPRSFGQLLWTAIAAFVLGLHQVWILPVGLAMHAVFAAVARRDPFFFDVFLRAIHAQRRLEP
jgi:type IV secretion system protein VirB3